MSSTFKYHSNVDEVVPWQATYTFPSQATKVNKQTVKLVPKNGSSFSPNNIVRIEFPADNYLNVLNSCLQFDVQWNITDTNIYATTLGGSSLSGTPTATRIVLTNANVTALTGTLSTTSDGYRGYTLAIKTSTGIYYSVVGEHIGGGTTTILNLVTPLPVIAASTNTIFLIPPYALQRGGSQNFIKRLRVIYGSIVLEDIMEYKTLVRIFYETGVDPGMAAGAGNILEGMYASHSTDILPSASVPEGIGAVTFATGDTSARALSTYIGAGGSMPGTLQSQLQCAPALSSTTPFVVALGNQSDAQATGRTTYTINLLSGIFTQKKLIPLKWMAAQLALEITLAPVEECALGVSTSTLSYQWSNVNFIAEMLEFDSAYDTAFYQGLMSNGVPIKFSSFHYHSFNLSGTYNIAQIHERSRSVKAAYAVARDTLTASVQWDTDRFFFALGETWETTAVLKAGGQGQVQQFQWRVGGRYYPAQPIRTIYGGAEAMMELQKALDMLGDYTRQGNFSRRRWATHAGGNGGAFIMAAPFENTDVFPDTISGINAEEQSDIALFITSDSNTTPMNKKLDVFMHYDALIIVRDGNVVDLVL